MKKFIILMAAMTCLLFSANAQNKKDGTPDMRYKANRQTNTNYYPTSSYTNPNVRYQSGYIRTNGTYVTPHYKTNPNSTNLDNFSTEGNTNPYTGETGSKAADYSNDAYNYGSGQQIQTGPRGGQYYINSQGNKTYVPRRGN